jgi:hypothetical protein
MATTDLYSQYMNPMTPEIMGLERQRQYARMLMQQSAQPQGEMVSGRYVAPSWTQQLNAALNPVIGAYLTKGADEQALKLAKQLREQEMKDIQQYTDLLRGKPEVVQQAGPMPDGGNIAPQIVRGPADPQSAYLYGASSYSPALRQVALKKLTEGPQWKEISQFNRQTGDTENYRYDANSANPRETMQFLGISKPAISPEAQIRFGDDNIYIPPQFRGGATTQTQTVSPYGANVQFTPTQPTVRPQGQPMGQPTGQPQVAPTVTPTVGGTAPTVASAQGYDYFKAPPVPAGLSGKQAREWQADQAKPLTGESEKQVTGAINYQKSLVDVQNLLDKYQGADLLKPNIRAEIQAAVENARLQGKEANRLGALTGPDYGILEKIVTDPTAFDAFLKDRSTINKLYNNQRLFTGEIIKTNYRSAQKAVPENLREYVQIKPIELTDNKPKDGNVDMQTKLRGLGIPYQPRIYEYRVNPDGSVDRKRKTQ